MFHKAKTEKERQKIFDDYLLGILKRKKIIKNNQKLIDESGFSYDPEKDNNQIKGTFNSYVDTLVIKNYMIEQLQSRLKISKSLSTNFINKLNGNEILILSKNLNDFIKYIDENHNNINDYILKSSFNVLQSNYNVAQQQEKNKEIIKDNQQAQGEILQENIPEKELGGAEEVEAEKETPSPFEEEEQKFISFLNKTIFKITGKTKGPIKFSAISTKKMLLSDILNEPPETYRFSKNINQKYIDVFIPIIESQEEEDKRDVRLQLQDQIKNIFFRSVNIPDSIKDLNSKLFDIKIVGTGYGVVNNDPYINIGKYLVHKHHLLGGKLQVRSPVNHNQIHGFKSQNITNNIKNILLKLNKNETISFSDVDKLSETEKNQLYTIGKKLHITELFDIPSTLKSNEDKLKDEFYLLRGSIMAGNNNPDLLRKFKIVLLKMKNNKLITLQEYNEVLNILLEMEI